MPDPAAAFAAAVAHHAAGRVRDAAVLYKQVIAADPDHADALHRLGAIAHAAGHHGDAARLIGRAVALQPDHAAALVDLGVTLHAAGRSAAAVDCYRRAIAVRPTLAAAHNNLGNALQALGERDAAIDSYRRAIAEDPASAIAHGNLGNALREAGQVDASVAAHQRAIALRPTDARSHHNLALSLADAGQHDAAADARRRSIELEPALADPAAAYRAAVTDAERHVHAGQPAAAAAAYRRATTIAPQASAAWFNLSVALADSGDPDAALQAAQHALRLTPDDPETLNQIAVIHLRTGRADAAVAFCRRAVAGRPADDRLHSNLVYSTLFSPAAPPGETSSEARRFAARHLSCNRPPPYASGGRLRVGYVSPDFRDHVVGRNVLPILAAHDRASIDVFCYSNVTRPDDVTARFREASDGWRDISRSDDAAAADLIRADRIDVLVDLTLHMADNRLALFARRPAPVQVTFAGYPGTTGLPAIDYRLTDPYLDPPAADGDDAERSVRLPHSFWCYDPAAMGAADQPPPGPPPAVANGFVTFGCLNAIAKVNDAVLAAWGRVLDGVPGSRLVMLAPPGSARTWARAALGDRVAFVPVQPRADYLATYRGLDACLDTFPYNGHTTGLDGLWQGVPTVTLVGPTVVGRAGWSQLSNLGLTDLAAPTVDAFVDVAVRLATDLPRLTALRLGLRDRMRRSPLCDVAAFTRGVEAAYRRMVDGVCNPPFSDGPEGRAADTPGRGEPGPPGRR